MTDRYVGPGGNDGNSGLTWALRKLTLNGAEDTPVVAGDNVYVGPGVYREQLRIDVDGTVGNRIAYIGDVTGENTDGVGGVVRITGLDADSDASPTRQHGILVDYDYRTFRGFFIDSTSTGGISLNSGSPPTNTIIEDCVFQGITASPIWATGAGFPDTIVRRCILIGRGSGSTQGLIHALDTIQRANDNWLIENCVFINVTDYGMAIYCNYHEGWEVKNCLIFGCHYGVSGYNISANPMTVNNCIIHSNRRGVNAGSVGDVIEDYNCFWANYEDRWNVSVGSNSIQRSPLFEPQVLLDGFIFPSILPFVLSEWSDFAQKTGSSQSVEDLYGVLRPLTASKISWGPIQYREKEREEGLEKAIVVTERFYANTTLGIQTLVTDKLKGMTPVAAIVTMVGADTNGVPEDHARISRGFTDGTTTKMIHLREGHGITPTDSTIGNYHDIIRFYETGGDSVIGMAKFDSWIKNGMRIDWDAGYVPDDDYLIEVTFFAGTSVEAKVGETALGDVTGIVANTAVGFEADLVFHLVRDSNVWESWQTATEITHGISHNDGVGGVVDRSFSWAIVPGQAAQQAMLHMRTDAGVFGMYGNAERDWSAHTQDYDSAGWDYDVESHGTGDTGAAWLAITFNGEVDSWVGTFTTPITTGDDEETGPGFKPQCVGLFMNPAEVAATAYLDERAGAFGFAVFDTEDISSQGIATEDGANPSNTQSSSSGAVRLYDDGGASEIQATFVSMDTNGWTLNFNPVHGTAQLWPAWAVEEQSADSSRSIKLDDAGDVELFVPVDGTEITISVDTLRSVGYAGTLPQMIIRQPGQSDRTTTDTGSADQWNELSDTFTPDAGTEFVIVILRSLNTATVGSYAVFFNDLAVS